MGFLSPKCFIFFGCFGLLSGYRTSSLEKISKDAHWMHWAWEYTKFSPNLDFAWEKVRYQMEPYWQEQQLLYLFPWADIARLVMRALPLLYAFMGMKPINPNVINCPICIEEFKNEELIQPFFFWGGGGGACPWISFVLS